MPDKAEMKMVALEDHEFKNGKYGFWDNVYGVKMSSIKQIALAEPLVEYVDDPLIISKSFLFHSIDLYTVQPKDLDFSNKYQLLITRSDTVHALCGWFDMHFSKLSNPVRFSTG